MRLEKDQIVAGPRQPLSPLSYQDEALEEPAIQPSDVLNFGKMVGAGVAAGVPLMMKFGRMAIHPQEMDPKRFQTIKDQFNMMKPRVGYEEEKFKTGVNLRITLPDGEVFEDGIKGLNVGHALRRAADNWPAATRIQVIGVEK